MGTIMDRLSHANAAVRILLPLQKSLGLDDLTCFDLTSSVASGMSVGCEEFDRQHSGFTRA